MVGTTVSYSVACHVALYLSWRLHLLCRCR